MEKRPFDDQKIAARFERVRAQVLAHPALFASQGFVAATWRTYRGRRLGPYFRVSYRESGRQRSIYLGRSEELADRVRGLLADVQRRRRQRRLFAKLAAQVRASLRRHKARWKEDLAQWGIRLKGWEFRGARQGLARYVDSRSRGGLLGQKMVCESAVGRTAAGLGRCDAERGNEGGRPPHPSPLLGERENCPSPRPCAKGTGRFLAHPDPLTEGEGENGCCGIMRGWARFLRISRGRG